ncbi:MAG: short-chain dehydrogenase/reductase [Candidatus Saccharibacteria bacterium]|nr:short-chain dehydrogenase/reductase [Candidatus Saccharibacteria bacterium]
MSETNQYSMQDPRTQFDQPDIPKDQKQDEPGLDAKLQPHAHHGEQTYVGSGKLKGRKALITGGDSGIGQAVAIAYAREGADVAIVYLPEEEKDASHTLAMIKDAGQKAIAIAGDIKSEAFCKSVISQVVEGFGSIDILVNNAGKQVFVDDLQNLTTEQFEQTFQTNVFAMFWLTKAAVPHMPAGSTIINTTSIQSYQPSPGLLDYASTKGAITSFTKGLAGQLIEKGIRVNGVAPGPIWTPLQPSHGQPPDKLEKFGQDTPMGRAGQPAELAPTYVFLASQESSYITGEIIGVTGGKPIS